ncbi:hypothetical protein CKAH01_09454 [Colletotrichum kahawae]|uniref:Uncharacterized protein n=1 Tax=Colletotrichum kahawae TaxID=34407 RepID=A0AAD9Y0A1_COLKA|nr:hypothetical protein CKAH01_09454 [Colletotrichum kahawae]
MEIQNPRPFKRSSSATALDPLVSESDANPSSVHPCTRRYLRLSPAIHAASRKDMVRLGAPPAAVDRQTAAACSDVLMRASCPGVASGHATRATDGHSVALFHHMYNGKASHVSTACQLGSPVDFGWEATWH